MVRPPWNNTGGNVTRDQISSAIRAALERVQAASGNKAFYAYETFGTSIVAVGIDVSFVADVATNALEVLHGEEHA